MPTEIQWTDETWNPVTGCTKISPGCSHCYIERTPAFRIAGRKFDKGHIPLRMHGDRLGQPLRWRKPRRIFVNSLSDLFHDDVSVTMIKAVWRTMAQTPQHTYQILTKRPSRMRALLEGWEPLPNVWLGVSVENQHFADERIPLLLQTPAAVRFISAEPLLGRVDLSGFVPKRQPWKPYVECRHGYDACPICDSNPAPALDWVIVGGESGPGARPFDVRWARSIVEQCRNADVPVFVKQLGSNCRAYFDHREWPADTRAHVGRTMQEPNWIQLSKKGGVPDEWPTDLRIRQFPEVRA